MTKKNKIVIEAVKEDGGMTVLTEFDGSFNGIEFLIVINKFLEEVLTLKPEYENLFALQIISPTFRDIISGGDVNKIIEAIENETKQK